MSMYKFNFNIKQKKIDVNTNKAINVVPVDHNKLNNLDYEHSGHTGFASQKELEAISKKVMTDDERTKLSGIDSGTQVNKIESIKVNGTEVKPNSNKEVNIPVDASGAAEKAVSAHNTSSTAHSDIRTLVSNAQTAADNAQTKANEVEELIVKNGVIDGSPKGVYANLSALQTAFPSGANGVYVCSDNGHWYYWNGSAWTDGGVYQSSEDINQIKSDLDEVYPCVINKIEHVSINRFNPNTAEQKYLSNGEFVANTEWTLTDVIECNFGDTVYAKYYREGTTLGSLTFSVFLIGEDDTIIFFADGLWKSCTLPNSHQSISKLKGIRLAWKTSTFAFENRALVDIEFNTEMTDYHAYSGDYVSKKNIVEEKTKSRWKGKNVLVFGDSISTPNYPLDKHHYPKWNNFLADADGFTMYNYSVHGFGYLCGQGTSSQGEYNMIHQIETAKTELETANVSPDLIILFMGTNDYGNQVDIGTFGDGMYNKTYNVDQYLTPKYTDTSVINTFYGAVEHCMTRIREIWNDAKVCVLLPLQREYQYSATSGKALLDYANIIKEIADLLSYPCLDLYHNANFCPVNKYDRNRWTYEYPSESAYAGQHDGLHPNEEFCRDRLAIIIGKFIENI